MRVNTFKILVIVITETQTKEIIMLELLSQCWGLVLGLAHSLWGVIVVVWSFVFGVLMHLHVEMPRLEGLLIGVALAWLMSRRDKHPMLKVLSAPLKLVIEVLDLAWDHAMEFIGDAWSVATGWVMRCVSRVRSTLRSMWEMVLSLLTGIRDRLKRE
jgi:hypothetical protein